MASKKVAYPFTFVHVKHGRLSDSAKREISFGIEEEKRSLEREGEGER